MSEQSTIIKIPLERIHDWPSFHAVFKEILGFPDFYGCNMNAWIDCMTSIDAPDDGMSDVTVNPDGTLILHFTAADDFQRRCPEQFGALVECSAFVNYRRQEVGERPLLALMISGSFVPGTLSK